MTAMGMSHANCTHPRTPAGRAACRAGRTNAGDASSQDGHLSLVAERARRLIGEYELDGWRFAFDNARRRFGYCRWGSRVIQISRPLAEMNSWDVIRATVLHEIAHALAGPGHGHDQVWRDMAVRVGASPSRCYDSAKVTRAADMWVAVCATCGGECARARQPRRKLACHTCCRDRNGGRFDERFLLTFARS